MNDPEKPQTSSASINAQGDSNIGGDVVGRDKIESHHHYQQAPSENQTWEMLYAAGWLARTLYILGMILVFGGVLTFIGTFLLGGVIDDYLGQAATERLILFLGPGACVLGIIVLPIGWTMVSHEYYRKIRSSRGK